jgi:hypothetical protein
MSEEHAYVAEFYVRLTLEQARELQERADSERMSPRDLIEKIVRKYLEAPER